MQNNPYKKQQQQKKKNKEKIKPNFELILFKLNRLNHHVDEA